MAAAAPARFPFTPERPGSAGAELSVFSWLNSVFLAPGADRAVSVHLSANERRNLQILDV
jgi:hypothetical protein